MNNERIHSRAKLIVSLRHEVPQYDDEKISKLLDLTIDEFNDWIKEHEIYITLYEKHEREYIGRLYKFEEPLKNIEKFLKDIKNNSYKFYEEQNNIISVNERLIDERLIQMEKLLDELREANVFLSTQSIKDTTKKILDSIEAELYSKLSGLFEQFEQNKQLDRIEVEVLQTSNFLKNNFVFDEEEDKDD